MDEGYYGYAVSSVLTSGADVGVGVTGPTLASGGVVVTAMIGDFS